MLVSLYRDGPLRQRILKGYVVAATNPYERIRPMEGQPIVSGEFGQVLVRCDIRRPGAVWLDSGPVYLYAPQVRARVAGALAQATAALSAEVRSTGGNLLPAAFLADSTASHCWLVGDLHDVEVLGDIQRELCTNLFRQYTPALIALAGRAAYGPHSTETEGSRRLAEATDQLATHYIHSFSSRHLDRVRESLQRDEGIARLELMDVNPFGDPLDNFDGVSLRMLDAQQLVSSTMAHALLVQALAMRARRIEREGRRVGAIPQPLLDRNRSRAIAHGLSARFEEDQTPGGTSRPKVKFSTAADACLNLVSDLLPEFRSLDATFCELSPLVTGLTLQQRDPLTVRNENDLVARWSSGVRLTERELASALTEPDRLLADRIGACARESAPGAASVVELTWSSRLAGEADAAPEPRRLSSSGERPARPKSRAQVPTSEKATKALLSALDRFSNGVEVAPLLREYLASGGSSDLDRQLRRLDRERARGYRRQLRPRGQQAVSADALQESWASGRAAQAVRLAHRNGLALLAVDLPGSERVALAESIRRRIQDCPDSLAPVVLSVAGYATDQGRRARTELLLVRRTEEAAA
ncbi:hypothetical protein [Kitasatospora sp. NPDC059571]|uniref:hypothetical protein n=1 Tax=Kitasatospora sp. NPDC059571 TaxID=3346871 RepID=UPI0036A4589F